MDIQIKFADAAYEHRDDWACLKATERILDRNPMHAETVLLRGLSLARQGELEDARDAYEILRFSDRVRAARLREAINEAEIKK